MFEYIWIFFIDDGVIASKNTMCQANDSLEKRFGFRNSESTSSNFAQTTKES